MASSRLSCSTHCRHTCRSCDLEISSVAPHTLCSVRKEPSRRSRRGFRCERNPSEGSEEAAAVPPSANAAAAAPPKSCLPPVPLLRTILSHTF